MQRISAVVLSAALIAGSLTPVTALPPELNDGRQSLFDGRSYLAGFPASKTRRQLRDEYLGVNGSGAYTNTSGKFDELRFAVDDAVAYRQGGPPPSDALLAQEMAWQSLEAALQGQLVTGNHNLLKGLRVAFPTTGGQNQRPAGEMTLPAGAPRSGATDPSDRDSDGGYRGTRAADLFYAKEHFARGISLVLEFMATDPSGEIRSTDLNNGLGIQFPQYTRFNEPGDLADPLNFGNPADQGADDPDQRNSETTGYLMGNLLDRYGKAAAGIGERFWKAAYFLRKRAPGQPLAQERPELLAHAQNELRKNAHFQYLASLPLAATMGDGVTSTLNEFQECRVDQARTSSHNAGVFIERIQKGEMPKLDSFELNSSTQDIAGKIALVNSLQANAQTAYGKAKDAVWKAKTAETEAISSAQQLRTQFTAVLAELTGLDPGVPGDDTPYKGLVTDVARTNYRIDLYNRILAAVQARVGSPTLMDGSELGKTILQIRRAEAQLRSAENRRDNIPQEIKIIEDREKATGAIILGTEDRVSAYRFAMGVASSVKVTVSKGISVPLTPPYKPSFNAGVSQTFDPGAIVVSFLQNLVGRAEALKQIAISNAGAEAEIRRLLLQQNQYALEIEESVAQLQLTFAELQSLISKAERLIEDNIYYQTTNASKYWSDPALMFEREKEELDYEEAQTEYLRELYVLTKMLEARWAENFENPVYDRNYSPVTLGGGLYDAWTQPESIFNAKDVDEAATYQTALRAWDQFLRTQRNGGDREDTAEITVSLRQDILGWSDIRWNGAQFVANAALKRQNLKRFQAWLLANRNPSANDQLRIQFNLVYGQSSQSRQGPLPQQPDILSVGSDDWNLRLSSFRARLIGSSVTQTNPFRLDFYQYGRVEIPRYHPRTGDKLLKTLDLPKYYSDPLEASTSPYRFSVQAGIGASSNPPVSTSILAAGEPSPFSSGGNASPGGWVILVKNSYGVLNVQNLEDIEFLVKLKGGVPPAFPGL